MSVINQMLRDLDQRGQSAQGAGLHPGTQSVAPLPAAAASRTPSSAALLGAVLGLGAVVAGLAWQQGYLGVQPAAAPTVPAAPAPLAASVPPAALSPAETASAASAVAGPVPDILPSLQEQPVSLRLDGQLEQLPAPAVPAMPAQAAVKPKAAPVSGRVAVVPALVSSAAVVTAPVAPAPATKPEKAAPATPVQPPAAAPATASTTAADTANPAAGAREALTQAQALWAGGNAAAATELLREALQAALRVRAGSGSVAMDTTVLAMVRELARMQMGTGQAEAAHELLVQHEARFRGQADYWATRANAAQRLGQHADSVQSYMQALQFRPHEQRWLLGLAVSLAAMGQTAAATSMAEKARAEGPLPREIAEYLRQIGVITK